MQRENQSMRDRQAATDVTIVMPCLNETLSLPHCIANAFDALQMIEARYGLRGEIVVADNGSTDGSQALAAKLGARVVPVFERGYGAALIGGARAARGRFIMMGDCDGSYDFTDGVEMIGHLLDGHALCVGSRFAGGIAPGAMPWKNRYLGNPVLTGVLNLFFGAKVQDAHCGLRALTKDAFLTLNLKSSGMEFASEMIVKALIRKMPIAQIPVTLSCDLRDRPPHLKPWRDGWRHLRFLMMLSPAWAFGAPSAGAALFGAALLFMASVETVMPGSFPAIGNYWVILAGAALSSAHLGLLFTYIGKLWQVLEGYRPPSALFRRLTGVASLENVLTVGLAELALSGLTLGFVLFQWSERGFEATYNVLPAVLGTLAFTLGMQTVMGAFLVSIMGGNVARLEEGHPSLSADLTGEAV